MTIAGTWNTSVSSPMGAIDIVFDLASTGTDVTGTATSQGDTVTISEGTALGDVATWKMVVTKPMKLTFLFKVTVDGDALTGTAKPGAFPAAKLTGSRAS